MIQVESMMEKIGFFATADPKSEKMNSSCKQEIPSDVIKLNGSKRQNWWVPTSLELLVESESRILSSLKNKCNKRMVSIGPVADLENCEIWTISMNEESQQIPLLLLHGMGAGVGFWSLNLDTFAATRPVYAIDHLGFGRSSRPKFSTDPLEAEQQFVTAIEQWRQKMGLDRFIILGHSLGGFLATSYALLHPERVCHLILADPWGFCHKPKNMAKKFPLYAQAIIYFLGLFNPIAMIRAAGPLGQVLFELARPDLVKKFSDLNREGQSVRFGDYVYHANAQTPSGEEAFKHMSFGHIWSKKPMVDRLHNLSPNIPLTAIYGGKSWVPFVSREKFDRLRQSVSYNEVQLLHDADHHVYSDGKDTFHKIVLESCQLADNRRSKVKPVPVLFGRPLLISQNSSVHNTTYNNNIQENFQK